MVLEDWKQVNVTCIFKKGNKQTHNNNCPIILTPLISKTIERLLKVRITKHLDDQNLFTDTQHGFRRKHSCITNLLDFFGEVDRIYDHAKAVNLVYLDFHRAFDKVPHERLMAKVETHGIQGNYSRWVRNWLTGRTERVMIHDQASIRRSNIRSPQESVLGPLLFIIYINDLNVGIISKINKFADDTKLCYKAFIERDRVTIQPDLNLLLQFTETWQMSFNIDKCSVMHVGVNNQHFQHTMADIHIEAVQQQGDQGLIVTENIKHDKHVEKASETRPEFLVSLHETLITT
ncbi:Reverse transcriptase domain [Trinorchestia longiramus]|nr:Reverse transcriptase domain [Trinorchestia longiramus]